MAEASVDISGNSLDIESTNRRSQQRSADVARGFHRGERSRFHQKGNNQSRWSHQDQQDNYHSSYNSYDSNSWENSNKPNMTKRGRETRQKHNINPDTSLHESSTQDRRDHRHNRAGRNSESYRDQGVQSWNTQRSHGNKSKGERCFTSRSHDLVDTKPEDIQKGGGHSTAAETTDTSSKQQFQNGARARNDVSFHRGYFQHASKPAVPKTPATEAGTKNSSDHSDRDTRSQGNPYPTQEYTRGRRKAAKETTYKHSYNNYDVSKNTDSNASNTNRASNIHRKHTNYRTANKLAYSNHKDTKLAEGEEAIGGHNNECFGSHLGLLAFSDDVHLSVHAHHSRSPFYHNWSNTDDQSQSSRYRRTEHSESQLRYSSSSAQNCLPTPESVNYKATSLVNQEKTKGATRKHRPKNNNEHHNSILRHKSVAQDEDATRRDNMIEQLRKNDYECMVCCERVRVKDSIWSCANCFHVFHLNCVYKWAKSPAAVVENEGWRCPACQQTTTILPTRYYCFCGKVEKPEWNPYQVPHSCGDVCGKKRDVGDCDHCCTLQCHPGPCPPCSISLCKRCECGCTFQHVRCGQTSPILCDNRCGKLLNCGLHVCQRKCHQGPCSDCKQTIKQTCFCGKDNRTVECTEETSGVQYYGCTSECGRVLSCGMHKCKLLCHPGDCPSCNLLPEKVTHCPCGKTSLINLQKTKNLKPRQKCCDPIPTCENICSLPLECGPENNPHTCLSVCHQPPCPPCPNKTLLKCRCEGQSKEFPCESIQEAKTFLCERRCNKKKACGRHKCLNVCCVETTHPCMLICNRRLGCGQHFCQEHCHNGKCPPCLNVSFEDLTCHCGASVIYAPIRCGTKPPECNQPCAREHPCDHTVHHTCHSDEKCPPCTVLMEKRCYGGHELRANVPCHLVGLSCGKICDKPLPCGSHTCQQVCHKGPCVTEGEICMQPCKKERTDCGHECGVPCHSGPCPDTICKALISVNCSCGQRSEKVVCGENSRLYSQVSAPLLASKMQKIQSGQTVDISDVISTIKTNKHNKLECNEQCLLIERNRRLALALQIRNPDLSNKPGVPNYSNFLIEHTKKNLPFVTSVFEQLTELVQAAKKSNLKMRVYSFQPMNREHRRVIHELAEYFGCKTESVDLEPKRSVEVTAFRDKSWLPSLSIMAVVQRNMGQRKGPTPVVSVEKKKEVTANTSSTGTSKEEEKEVIDYFDFS